MNRLYFVPLITSFFWGITALSNAAEVIAPQEPPSLEEAARFALRATQAAQLADRADVEDVYRWSLRLKNAERAAGKKTAAREHFERMEQLNQKYTALMRAGVAGASEVRYRATTYYMLKAKSALERANATK